MPDASSPAGAGASRSTFALDRAVVIVAAALVTSLAWLYLAAFDMPSGMAMEGGMQGHDAGSMAQAALRPWTPGYFALMATMWSVMMVGMMVPSVTPMLVLYDRVARQAASRGDSFAATGWFAAGYLLAWVLFGLLAAAAQWRLEQALLLSPMMAATSTAFGAGVLIAAGLYQWTPLKDRCLALCQSPLVFIHRHGGFRREPRAALLLGARHGLYCVGCCWALMALLFVVGVMNLLWVALIALYVLVEKLVPAGRIVPRLAGTVLVAAGVWMVAA